MTANRPGLYSALAALAQAALVPCASAAEPALPWIQEIPAPGPQAYLEIGNGAREGPRVWVQAAGIGRPALVRFGADGGDAGPGCFGARDGAACDKTPPVGLRAAVAACLQSPEATHYFIARTTNTVFCLSRLPEIATPALRQASGVVMLASFEPRWTPPPVNSRGAFLHDLFATAPLWGASNARVGAVACQKPAEALGAYSTTDFWKDTQAPGVTELSAPHLVWAWKYLVKLQQPLACGPAHYRIDHPGALIGMLPDGTALVGGGGSVLRVRLADGSSQAAPERLRRVPPRPYIESLVQAGTPGCVDGRQACAWTQPRPAAATSDPEVDYAVRWLEGLDRAIEDAYFKPAPARAGIGSRPR